MQLPAHTDISGVFKLVNNQLDQVKDLINEQLADCSESVSQLLGTFGICSGKMLRPGLVLLSYRAVHNDSCGKRNTAYPRHDTDVLIRVAAIVETIHNATLLHDDVIDEGQKRRGAPTVNSLWGNESAVLLGDFLLSKVFRMCVDLEPQVTDIIAATSVRLCEGELRQIAQRRNWRLSESEYIDIITEKSAALFSNACLLGALLAQASETQVKALADFGLNFGIAFQITDDLLDIIGDESKTGKTLGTDVDKNKLTLAMIHLLRAVDEREKDAVKSKLNAAEQSKESLAAMLRSNGSLEYAHNRAQEFVAKAISSLAGLKESDAKDALIETAGFAAARGV